MAVPVNLRSDDDPAGGNRFAGINLAAPVGVVDPTKRILMVRKQMMSKREERAIDMVGAMIFVHIKNGFASSSGGIEFPLALLAMALVVAFAGPGKFAPGRKSE